MKRHGEPRPRRRPGRPSAGDPSGAQLRERVIEAATLVYAEKGFHRSAVEDILDEAGISRPTFYRMFSGKKAAFEEVVVRANDALRNLLEPLAQAATSIPELVRAGVDAYFEWGTCYGAIVASLYREMHDPESPASTHRTAAVVEVIDKMTARLRELGFATVDRDRVEMMVQLVEHIGSITFHPADPSPEKLRRNRELAMNVALLVFQPDPAAPR